VFDESFLEPVFDEVELHDVFRLLGQPEGVKVVEYVNYTITTTRHNDTIAIIIIIAN